MDFGLRCSQDQMRKLKNGGAITLNANNMDDSSPVRMMLCPQTGRRVATAMRKNKGFRVALRPDEDLVDMTTGGSLKSMGKAVRRGAKKTTGAIKRGFDREIVDSGVGKEIAKNLIMAGTDVVLPAALGGLSMMAGDPTGMSGQMAAKVAGKYIDRAAAKGGYGMKPKKVFKKIGKVVKKVSKNPIVREIGKQVLEEGSAAVGDALTAYTGNPAASIALQSAVKKGEERLKESKGNFRDAAKSTAKDMKRYAVEEVDDWVDKNLTGIERDIAQGALAGKYPSASDLVYDYAKSTAEQQLSGYGLPRRVRGGLRMGKGLAHLTPAYEQAMRSLSLSGSGMMTGGSFLVGGRVAMNKRPDMMMGGMIQTGSPYQELGSPAMNPFIAGSPQLVGGSFLLAGERRGGSMYPAGV